MDSFQPDYAARRQAMVEYQLRRRGIGDERVMAAMARVPREEFVPPDLRDMAYHDCALPLSLDQTISQPYTVAFMCQEACLTPADKVLEIGTGSGYGAAVLGEICREVHTVERLRLLAEGAYAVLSRLRYDNVTVHLDDGTLGLPAQQPFDAIVVTAGAEVLPRAYGEQLVEGGRLIIPIGPAGDQYMMRYTRQAGRLHPEGLGPFGFVPLLGGE